MSRKNKRQVSRAGFPTASAAAPRGNEFNPDYTTTRRELRRIGLLAGAFFVILIILAIFQNQILSIFMK